MAVDINARALERLRARVQQEALANVEVIQGTADDPHLAPASLDAVVIVNSYHEMHAHQAMLGHLRRALKPEGRLVIVEPLSEKRRHESREAQVRRHEIALHFVEDDVRGAGFKVARTEDPFTVHGPTAMSLLVAVPGAQAADRVTPTSSASSTTPSKPPTETDADESTVLSSPDLRVPLDRFKQLRDDGRIIVVDVRAGVQFRSGHLPEALSIPLERIGEEAERLRAPGKAVVTYCS